MNFSSFIGVLMAVGIMAASILESGMDPMFFLNFHGLVIVLGGTLAVASIMFPIKKVFSMLKIFFMRVLGKSKADFQSIINQILDINKKMGLGQTAFAELLPGINHSFLREAVELVAAGVLSEKEIRFTLDQRLKTTEHELTQEAMMFKSIGKFPPAFGLLATTLGMIALLSQIGKPGSEKLIGPAMSIGLVGTLYGISLANFVFLPISENLMQRMEEEIALRKMIIEGAMMLKAQTNPITLKEGLNSFLAPHDRMSTNKKPAA